jgi:hypothetical protein
MGSVIDDGYNGPGRTGKLESQRKKRHMKLTDTLQDKILTIGEETFRLSDYLRKNYQVESSVDGGLLWDTEAPIFNNSTEANAFAADLNAKQNIQARVVVLEVTDVLKKNFWNLWPEHKKAIQAQGVFVTKRDGKFVVSDRKATRAEIIRSKGYGRGGGYQAPEFDKHAMIDRDAERYGW